MKHLEIDAHWPDGHTQVGLRYGENWRKIRAHLRQQRKERPECTFTIRRRKPEARWILNAFKYADFREYDRDQKRRENGHRFKP